LANVLLRKRGFPLLIVALLLASSFLVGISNAGIIDYSWVDNIETYAQTIDENTTAEIVVCVFQTLNGNGITDSSGQRINDLVKLGVYVFNDMPLDVYDGTQTGIGKSGKDNGILVLVALEERQWRIEVGYDLEGYITDIETNLIAQRYLVPAFQQGDYGEGLYGTVIALGEQIPVSNQTNNLPVRGYYYYENDSSPTPTPTPFWDWTIFGVPLWVIVVFILFGVFIPVFGRGARGGGNRGGGGSGGGGSSGRW
jgi:uncharacterized protein